MSAAGAARAAFDVDAFLRGARDNAERALADLPLADVPGALHEPIDYAVRAGGKRLRPVLCATAWSAVTGAEAPAAVWRAAAAVELIHAYSLVHDDLPFMDDDDVRRGRPTTHRAHGTATATVAGAAMIAVAFRLLDDVLRALEATPEQRDASVGTLAEAAGAAGMVGGQWLDLAAEGRALQRAELERVHRLKTGALIRAPVLLGGILAGASAAQRNALDTYGASVGLAFQIADDLLDARGDSATIGKVAGRDAALAKSTYPGLLGIEAAERLARDQVEAALAALDGAGIRSVELEALAGYAVDRSS
ncbi:MAG TPA: farnesyl diphosphate synthase [Longimicrobiales bacterium]